MKDGELVAKALQGDSESFATLYDRHKDWVYHYIQKHLVDASPVADLVQETFMRALAGLARLEKEDDFGAWLNGITRHVVSDYLRGHYRQKVHFEAGSINFDTLPLSLLYPPAEENVLDSQTVNEILAKLPSHYQSLIRLRLLEGLSGGEVAHRLYGQDNQENRRKVAVGLYKAMQAARQIAEQPPKKV